MVGLGLIASLGACNIATVVEIALKPSGAGVVRVEAVADKQAAAQIGDARVDVHLGDLKAIGWTVTDPVVHDDGSFTVTLSRPFTSVDEGREVLAALSGPNGPLRDVSLTKSTGLGRTSVKLTGAADLTEGLAVLSDADLATTLGGDKLGAPLADLVERYEVTEADAFSLTVRAVVDGDIASETTVSAGQRKEFEAKASQSQLGRIFVAFVSSVLLVAGAALAVTSLRRRRTAKPSN